MASVSTSNFDLSILKKHNKAPTIPPIHNSTHTANDPAETVRWVEVECVYKLNSRNYADNKKTEAQHTQEQAAGNPRSDPEGVAFINFLNQKQRLTQQQQTAFLNILAKDLRGVW